MKMTLSSGDTLTAVDLAAEEEFGQGQTLEVLAPSGPPYSTAGALMDGRVQEALLSHAQLCLSPWSEPYRIVTLPLTIAHAGVQLGDVVDVSVWLLPDGAGSRGITSRRCLVVGRRLRWGEGLVELDVRIGDSTLSGYAPEVMVGAISGAANAIRATLGGTATTPGGTLAALQVDSNFATGVTLPGPTSFIRVTDTNTTKIPSLLNIPAPANGSIFATHTTQTMTHSIRIVASGVNYYVMCTDSATNRG
jgi:hypothetical protein